ncbi:hypothetical protein NONO_c59780 [Nocardia nova SH22a]|uniref:Uncharacterized protein n=1 Tax=Nocardia nova SH22a TaxID=1415166 RepID=W5TNL8_9NOCA|nr:hypothetical protein [Nocardia nova]AHH20754.1 hypothetical protein NONO_c59780 [Nocardia nova SH22a]
MNRPLPHIESDVWALLRMIAAAALVFGFGALVFVLLVAWSGGTP